MCCTQTVLGATLGVLAAATARYSSLVQRRSATELSPAPNRKVSRIGVPALILLAGIVIEAVCTWRIPIESVAFNGIALTGFSAAIEGAVLPALLSWLYILLNSPLLGACVLLPMCWGLCRAWCIHDAGTGAPRSIAATACYLTAVVTLVAATELSRAQEPLGLDGALALPTVSASALRAAHALKGLEQAWATRGLPGVLSAVQHALPMATVDAGGLWRPELSLMWYVSSAAFTRYLPYYRLIFAAHPLLYVLPVCWRLRHRPDIAVVVTAGLAAVFDPSAHWALARFPLVAASMAAHTQVVAREWPHARGSPRMDRRATVSCTGTPAERVRSRGSSRRLRRCRIQPPPPHPHHHPPRCLVLQA